MFKKRGRQLSGALSAFTPSQIEVKRQAERRIRNRKNQYVAGISSFIVLGSLSAVVVLSPGFKTLRDTFFDWADRKSTRLNSSHIPLSRMPSSA